MPVNKKTSRRSNIIDNIKNDFAYVQKRSKASKLYRALAAWRKSKADFLSKAEKLLEMKTQLDGAKYDYNWSAPYVTTQLTRSFLMLAGIAAVSGLAGGFGAALAATALCGIGMSGFIVTTGRSAQAEAREHTALIGLARSGVELEAQGLTFALQGQSPDVQAAFHARYAAAFNPGAGKTAPMPAQKQQAVAAPRMI
jgi:hypothetical protein